MRSHITTLNDQAQESRVQQHKSLLPLVKDQQLRHIKPFRFSRALKKAWHLKLNEKKKKKKDFRHLHCLSTFIQHSNVRSNFSADSQKLNSVFIHVPVPRSVVKCHTIFQHVPAL